MNMLKLTIGEQPFEFENVRVSPVHDSSGRFYLDIRKSGLLCEGYVGLLNALADATDPSDKTAQLKIGDQQPEIDDCRVTPKKSDNGDYYVDVRAYLSSFSDYQKAAKALADAENCGR